MKSVQALPNAKRIARWPFWPVPISLILPTSEVKWLSFDTPSGNIQRPILRIATLGQRSNAIIAPSSNRFANLLRPRTQQPNNGMSNGTSDQNVWCTSARHRASEHCGGFSHGQPGSISRNRSTLVSEVRKVGSHSAPPLLPIRDPSARRSWGRLPVRDPHDPRRYSRSGQIDLNRLLQSSKSKEEWLYIWISSRGFFKILGFRNFEWQIDIIVESWMLNMTSRLGNHLFVRVTTLPVEFTRTLEARIQSPTIRHLSSTDTKWIVVSSECFWMCVWSPSISNGLFERVIFEKMLYFASNDRYNGSRI
jgi:hypothetical protein